jgi:hypothetical protein
MGRASRAKVPLPRCSCKRVAIKPNLLHSVTMDARSPMIPDDPSANDLDDPALGLAGGGWHSARGEPSLAGVFASVRVAKAGVVLAQAAGVPGAGLSGRGRLYGPRQLGHLARRRFQIRLRAAHHRASVQHHGDRAAVAVHAAWGRRRARSRPGLPRFLSALGGVAALAVGGNRHYRDGSGRSDRHRDRPQSLVPYSARNRRHHHRRRRFPDPGAAGIRVSRPSWWRCWA